VSDLLADITLGTAALSSHRGERGVVDGRRTSTPLSRRSPADLDAIVLRDRRTGVVAVLGRWADRVRVERPVREPRHRVVVLGGQRWIVQEPRTIESESQVLAFHWAWAERQPWGPDMVAELETLREQLANGGRPVKIRPCPVCNLPVRVDRFVVEHRECIETPL
jgi:hypothetical protein